MSSTSPLRRSVGQVARAGEAVSRARLAVVPRLRSRAPRMPFVALVSLLLLGGVVGLLLFNTSMQQASFTASQLEEQADSLSAREQALVMELNQARNPQQLAMQACEIGMVAGPPAQFLDLDTGKVTGTGTAAAGAPCSVSPPKPVRPSAPDGVASSGAGRTGR